MAPFAPPSIVIDLDISTPPTGRRGWFARMHAAGSWLLHGGGLGLLVITLLFAGPVFARQELAAIVGWRIERLPVTNDSRPLYQAPPRVLRVMLNRQYPVMDRRTWIDVDGYRLGPAIQSADLRSLSVPLPTSVEIGQLSRIRIADGDTAVPPQAKQPRSMREDVPPALPWKAPAMKVIAEDPASAGPYEVEELDYWLGDEAFEFVVPGSGTIKAEMKARIYLPKDLEGPKPVLPMPVVLLLHGNHPSCYVEGGNLGFGWPCLAPAKPIDSYLGYAAIGKALASHGYVVVSISANGVNVRTRATARGVRAALLRAHLDYLKDANDVGTPELLNRLVGKLNLQNIGVMGHSRGGEGAVQAAIDGNAGVGNFKFKAVFALAPTSHEEDARVPGVALAVMLPYCDGDVTGLEGQGYIDASRHAFTDNVPRVALIVHGANHNFFNTMWTPGIGPGGRDDGATQGDACQLGTYYRLNAQDQEQAGAAYIAAFFRMQLGGEQQFAALFDGSATRAPGRAIVQSVATAPALQRLDVATFEQASSYVINERWREAQYCAGVGSVKPNCGLDWSGELPHWFIWGAGDMLKLKWSDRNARTQILLRGGVTDVSGYALLSLRAMPGYGGYGLLAPDLAFTLVDQQGRRATVHVSQSSDALASLPGFSAEWTRWILRGVQIPLTSFPEVDLTRITSIEVAPATDKGEVLLSDLAFVK